MAKQPQPPEPKNTRDGFIPPRKETPQVVGAASTWVRVPDVNLTPEGGLTVGAYKLGQYHQSDVEKLRLVDWIEANSWGDVVSDGTGDGRELHGSALRAIEQVMRDSISHVIDAPYPSFVKCGLAVMALNEAKRAEEAAQFFSTMVEAYS